MQVFPTDAEIATMISMLWFSGENPEYEKYEQIDFYNKQIMDPFFE